MDENVIAHAFHHNAFLIVSNGHRARYGSITGAWEHFAEWKRIEETDKGSVEAEVLLDGMLAHDRLLDLIENFVLFDESKPGGGSFHLLVYLLVGRRCVMKALHFQLD